MEGNWRTSKNSSSSSQQSSHGARSAFHNRHGGRGGSSWNNQTSRTQRTQHLPDNVKPGYRTDARITRVDPKFGTFVEARVPDTGATWTGLIANLHLSGRTSLPVTVTKVQNSTKRVDLIWTPPPPLKEDRPLLILDLNGVVLDRRPFDKRGKGNVPYVKRDHCDEFIRFCFENFHVGVWSCGTRKKMELELFEAYKNNMLFVFDQDSSTNLWPKRSVVSAQKPLFLKELSRVWEKFPQFNSKNTILIDNHLEKFQRNPVGTCMLIEEFDSSKNLRDDTLRSKVLPHLKEMANCSDIPAYMEQHKDSGLFPTEYPEIAGEAPPEEARAPAVNPSLRMEFAKLFTSSKVMKRDCPKRNANFYMSHPDTPGPRARPFARRKFQECANDRKTGYVVCEKTDGVRNFLFAPVGGSPRVFLVDRAWRFEQIEDPDHELFNALTDCGVASTMVDGELVNTSTERSFLVFDAVWVVGKDVGAVPDLRKRLLALDSILKKASEATKSSKVGLAAIVVKEFKQLGEVGALQKSVGSHQYEDGVGEVQCDGLVITPVREVYYGYDVIKYKPLHELTVDFKLILQDLRDANPPIYLKVYVPNTHKNRATRGEIAISTVAITPPVRQEIQNLAGGRPRRGDSNASVIIECFFDGAKGTWCYRNCRLDKEKPNAVTTAWAVMESVAENVTLDDFVKMWGGLEPMEPLGGGEDLESPESSRVPGEHDESTGPGLEMRLSADAKPFTPPSEPANSSSAATSAQVEAVAEHYNKRQELRNAKQSTREDIHALRKINNWAKAVMVQEWFSEMSHGSKKTKAGLASPAVATSGFVPIPHQLSRRASQPVKRKNQSKSRGQTAVDVIDIACGRGGDLLKWISSLQIQNLVGVDIAKVALAEAARRVQENSRRNKGKKNPKQFTFVQADAAGVNPRLSESVYKEVGVDDIRFDCMAAQFSFHYWCDTKERCSMFFSEASKLMKSGGRLVVTTTDSDAIRLRVSTNASGKAEFRNPVSSVVLKDPKGIQKEDFGIPYYFTLGDAVVDCLEFMVPSDMVLQLAQEFGFQVLYTSNLGKFVETALKVPEYRDLLQDMKVTLERGATQAEWDVIQLYKVFVFEKQN